MKKILITILSAMVFMTSCDNAKQPVNLQSAIGSFCLLEKRGLSFSGSLLGMIPVTAYGFLYLYKVIFAPEDRRWNDFYGFNKGGKWPLSLLCMLTGSFLLCMLYRKVQNR